MSHEAMGKPEWQPIDISAAKYLGYIEFTATDGDLDIIEFVATDTHIVFGGMVNVGLLQSGYAELDMWWSIDENLSDIVDDIETFYRDGYHYTTRIVVNARM